MVSIGQLRNVKSNRLAQVLIASQFAILVAIAVSVRSVSEWFWTIISFVPALILCIAFDKKRFVLFSILILFVSQHAVFIFARPTWGYDFMHDSINDLHMASVLSENAHFELGHIGYGTQTYTYFPLMHLFAVILSDVSALPLISIALYFVPIINALMVALLMYLINEDVFGLKGATLNLATLLFAMGWYYTFFQSQFTREAFAFPLALLAILIFARMSKSSNRAYAIALPVLFVAVILSHHITSYMLLVIMVIMAIGFDAQHKRRLYRYVLLMATILFAYISYVTLDVVIGQSVSMYESFLLLFQGSKQATVLSSSAPWQTYIAFSYYGLIGIFVLLEGTKLVRKRNRRLIGRPEILLAAFLLLIFAISVLLRLSVKPSPLSWAYDMSLRGTIWAFIGLPFLIALGMKTAFRLDNHFSMKKLFLICSLVCILAAGKFAQYPALVSNSSVPQPVSYSRYVAALWLKSDATHGANLLVASDAVDAVAFDASRSMAPYAYLVGYVLDDSGIHTYVNFKGYVPFIGGFFDQYKDSVSVQIVYDNGETEVGYKK